MDQDKINLRQGALVTSILLILILLTMLLGSALKPTENTATNVISDYQSSKGYTQPEATRTSVPTYKN